ncbi:YcjX family protein [Escherichia coli]
MRCVKLAGRQRNRFLSVTWHSAFYLRRRVGAAVWRSSAWPTPTRGVSEIRLALAINRTIRCCATFKDTSTLYLEIV